MIKEHFSASLNRVLEKDAIDLPLADGDRDRFLALVQEGETLAARMGRQVGIFNKYLTI